MLRLSGTLLAVNISLSLRLILDSKIPIPGVDLLTSIFPSFIEHKKDETMVKSMIKDKKNIKKPESIDDINNLDVSLDNESAVFADTELDSNSNDSNESELEADGHNVEVDEDIILDSLSQNIEKSFKRILSISNESTELGSMKTTT